ncbi:MAG: glycosyltransferase family 2 protein [Microbacteriaceae bacterium]
MYPRVTAIVVAHNGAAHLRRTLQALSMQTRRPDAVIAVDCASTDETAAIFAEYATGVENIKPGRGDDRRVQLLTSRENLPFGAALAMAARATQPTASDHEWLWLLAQDTAPDPRALELLLGAVEVSRSVVVAGPKLMDWDDPSLIREFGQSMTPLGASVPLVENELDQAQHDARSDVLAVAPAGMLVRHTLWEKLGGFDPALPVVDDGLDFCVRARLAGFRVTLVPGARVATAGDGVVGASRSIKWSARRRLFRLTRAAQLHRRMVYAPAAALPVHWLSLVPLAIVRSLGRLLGKQPGAIGAEFAAAFAVAFSGMRISTARHALAKVKTAGWASITPLRIPLDEVRRARALTREAALARSGGRIEFNFFAGGGAWTVLAAAVLGVVLFLPLLDSAALTGGSLLPLSADVGQLWHNLGYGWRDIGLGFVGAADPFAAVLAVLGTLTFWQPSLSIVLLFLCALPLAALGAWMCAARLTGRAGLRACAALLWMLAPTFLSALATGRPAAVLVHLLLPWLFFAGFAAARSWAASAATALLFAATIACAPSLAPALVLIWLGCVVASGRRLMRFIAIPLPAFALFAPLIWQQLSRGNWIGLLADPGLPSVSRLAGGGQLALGLPETGLAGWPALAESFGLSGSAAHLIVPILLAPLAILALLALFLRGSTRAVVPLAVALVGFATAVAAGQLLLQSVGSQPVAIWPGSGLSLYWLGLVGSATLALSAIRRLSAIPAIVCVLFTAVAGAPLALALPLGTSLVVPGEGKALPAFIGAEAANHPRVGTLEITPQPDGAIATTLLRGTGPSLDEQSTLATTMLTLDAQERQLAGLAANLTSQSGLDATAQLNALGIGFVYLTPPVSGLEPDAAHRAAATERRASVALDGNPVLAPVGGGSVGLLWSHSAGTVPTTAAAQIPTGAGGIIRTLILIGQALVIGITVLLSIPTGRARDRDTIPAGPKPPAGDPGAPTTAAEAPKEVSPDKEDSADKENSAAEPAEVTHDSAIAAAGPGTESSGTESSGTESSKTTSSGSDSSGSDSSGVDSSGSDSSEVRHGD